MKISITKTVKAIGHPPEDWIGNCYAIACQILEAGLVKGRAAYGHFRGEVSPDAPRFGEDHHRGWQRHGWIILEDGRVLDPTRWVFEAKKPYIYVGPNDHEYDEGGSELRKAMMHLDFRAFPEYDKERHVEFSLEPDDLLHYTMLAKQKNINRWSLQRVSWIANLPYEYHEGREERIYPLISKVAGKCLIPFDYQKRFEAEHGIELVDEKHCV